MSPGIDASRLRAALQKTTSALLAEAGPAGYWTGELSSSALSTAVATIALGQMAGAIDSGLNDPVRLVNGGLRWLADHVNSDGGWGDTPRSRSNLSTTALAWAAFGAAGEDRPFASIVDRAESWLWRVAGSREKLPDAIASAYGKDRTFSVPILMTLALSGRLGTSGWRQIPPLPFELAALPRRWFGFLQLPVVSYALPALIAIGQAIHHHAPSPHRFPRWLRCRAEERTLAILNQLQPPNGGFLEATPLTAFVTMSLACMGQTDHAVAQRGAAFLRNSVRSDGSWPIDTNLATWLTTIAVKALTSQPEALSDHQKCLIRSWLLGQRFQTEHPYTGAAPGGWAWTDLPGGVPDADDTAGALLALQCLGQPDNSVMGAVEAGTQWLLDLQNRDGGIPTFCRGWGTLPFDRSTPEITAHVLRAWSVWRSSVMTSLRTRMERALPRALRFLERSQRADGAWVPLWFGNEHAPHQENPVYGTAQTLVSLNDMSDAGVEVNAIIRRRAAAFLSSSQNVDGGWGGDASTPESIEETALAVEALAGCPRTDEVLRRGILRLLEMIETERAALPAPIGLYFARLWYFDRLYPLLFATSALGRVNSKQL